MTYPSEACKAKHDLITPPFSDDIEDQFSNAKELFRALGKPIPRGLEQLCSVYSYEDGPNNPGPLSRSLIIIGFAEVSLSVVRKLISIDETPECLTKCKIAVKNLNSASLPERDVRNSTKFVGLMKLLVEKDMVAILGKDKYERISILQPMIENSSDSSDEKYSAWIYVGNIKEIKQFLVPTAAVTEPHHPEAEPEFVFQPEPDFVPPPEASSSDSLWQPPGTDVSSGFEVSANEGLWQPPGTDSGSGFEAQDSSQGLWQPPTGDDNANTDDAAADPWGTATTITDSEPNAFKRPFDSMDVESSTHHADSGAAAADAFYSGLTRSMGTRADSILFHMRSFNGWVKATQIQELDPKTAIGRGPMRVLDLACGKGGDLGKWVLHNRGIKNYVGIDVARGSLKDAAIRARRQAKKLKRCTFTVADLGSDVPGRLKTTGSKHMQKLLSWSMHKEGNNESNDPEFNMVRGGGIDPTDKFDVVSVQFAIHYMMSSLKRARRFFQTVSDLLDIGGNLIATTIDARVILNHMMGMGVDLHKCGKDNNDGGDQSAPDTVDIVVGNGACTLSFQPDGVKRVFDSKFDGTELTDESFNLEYTFTLTEGSDHAAGVGEAVDLPEWLTPIPVLTHLAKEAGLELEYAHNFHEFYGIRKDPSEQPAAHSALYNMKVLNQKGSISPEEWEISRLYVAIKFRKVAESSVVIPENEEDEEEEEEEEIKVDQKTLFKAMMKAKKTVGSEWKNFSEEEQKHRIQIEIKKMM